MNYTVEFDNTTEAAAEATAATIDLRTGDETIEVLNETVSASELAVDGKTSKGKEYKFLPLSPVKEIGKTSKGREYIEDIYFF